VEGSGLNGLGMGLLIFGILMMVFLGFSIYINTFLYKKEGYKSIGSLFEDLQKNFK
jgi:hypothetical protein